MRSASSHAIRRSASRWGGAHGRCTNRDSRRRSRWRNGRKSLRMRKAALAIAMTAALVVFFVDPQPKANPADEAAFAQTVESALDSNSPARLERWHAAQGQGTRLDHNR